MATPDETNPTVSSKVPGGAKRSHLALFLKVMDDFEILKDQCFPVLLSFPLKGGHSEPDILFFLHLSLPALHEQYQVSW